MVYCLFLKASLLTGVSVEDISSAKEAAQLLVEKGCKCVIITLGKQGCVYIEGPGECARHVPVPVENIRVIDTTVSDLLN